MAYDDQDFKVDVALIYQGKIVECTHAFRSFASGATEADVLAQVYRIWGEDGGLLELVSDAVDVHHARCARLDGTLVPVEVAGGDLGGNTSGTTSGTPVPPQCAMVMTLQTNFAGRRNRGRNYIPYLRDGFLLSEQTRWDVLNGLVSAAAANMVALSTDAVDVAGSLAVNSRVQQACIPVVNVRPNAYIGTQRRRAEAFA
jgi:hypothetical protein